MLTRMFLHNETWPYRYFITLTYSPAYSLGINNLKDYVRYRNMIPTLPTYNNENSSKRYGYQPTILCRKHLQQYFKRLRYSYEGQLSYFACGEYGTHTTYARPHYHAIVWSKEPIPQDLFASAWGLHYSADADGNFIPYKGQKDLEDTFVSFGRTDIVDLNAPRYIKNEHGKTLADVFKYVAKYVNKYENVTYWKKIEKKSPLDLVISKINSNFASEIKQKRYFYERKCIKEFDLWSPFDPYAENVITDPLVPYSEHQFRLMLAPFALQSESYAIGKEWLTDNLEGLAKGLYQLPKNPAGGTRFPHYYARKITETLHPIRVYYPNKTGYTCAIGNIPLLYNALRIMALSSNFKSRSRALALLRNSHRLTGKKTSRLGLLVDSQRTCYLYDMRTKERLLCTKSGLERFNSVGELLGVLSYKEVFETYTNGYKYLVEKYNDNAYQINREYQAACHIQETLSKYCTTLTQELELATNTLHDNLVMHQNEYYKQKLSNKTIL